MDKLQPEEKSFFRRYRCFIVAFVSGFLPGAALAGVMTGADLWSKPETSELIMVLHTAQSAVIGGLLSGGFLLVLYLVFVTLKAASQRLLK